MLTDLDYRPTGDVLSYGMKKSEAFSTAEPTTRKPVMTYLDRDLYAEVKARAKENMRSVSAEVALMVKRSMEGHAA